MEHPGESGELMVNGNSRVGKTTADDIILEIGPQIPLEIHFPIVSPSPAKAIFTSSNGAYLDPPNVRVYE